MRASFASGSKQPLLLRPGLRQSSRLLQLSSIDFVHEIREALASNPFLEEETPNGAATPARAMASDLDHIVPDIIVRRDGQRWSVDINASLRPCARLNQAYADALRASGHLRRDTIARQLQEARWLLRSAERRLATIRRVAETIIEHQHDFFEYGEIALKPLALRDIAAQLGLHESTISRASGNKYMATPRGLYEFRYFFSRELPTRSGDTCSAASVRALIAQMIAGEPAHAPLSDVALARLLAERGVRVARRTVSKYRGMLGLPPVETRATQARAANEGSMDGTPHRH